MKVFVATKQTQGVRANDFSHAQEGELVRFGFECDGEDVDDSCGCRRALVGVKSSKATTTFRVAELSEATMGSVSTEFFESYKQGGWIDIGGDTEENRAEWLDMAREDAEFLCGVAADWPIGTVVEKRGNDLNVRQFPGQEPLVSEVQR
jgi:hypothetical protein